jgi:hypothetical protein
MNDQDFYSFNGNKVNLGKSKHRSSALNSGTSVGKQMLYHSGSNIGFTEQGLHSTKFHRGFDRRKEANISNIFSDREKEYVTVREEKAEALNKMRTQRLEETGKAHGYDIITAQPFVGSSMVPEPLRRRTYSGYGLGDDSIKSGEITLRGSTARFYRQTPSDPMQEYRQLNLVADGLQKEKRTRITNTVTMPSYGMEDQFSKSLYTHKSEVAMRGLVELSKPGALRRLDVSEGVRSKVSHNRIFGI